MGTNIEKYFEQEKALIEEIQSGKLTYKQARDKCNELYNLIPIDYEVNPAGLQNAMTEAYPNILDHSEKRIYKIPVGDISSKKDQKYIDKLIKKYKR